MLAVGNKKHQLIWEARRPRNKPTSSSTREEREAFIRAKYISKEFLFELAPGNKDLSEVCCHGVCMKLSALAVLCCVVAYEKPFLVFTATINISEVGGHRFCDEDFGSCTTRGH